MYSLIIPVYGNEGSLPEVISTVSEMATKLADRLEVVFVVDGSPDESYALLKRALHQAAFGSQLLLLSRNFGSFAAIREGLRHAQGDHFAVMAADLQEPPELVLEFFRALESEPVDIAVGARVGRADPFTTRVSSQLFWWLYRLFVQAEMPAGGIDVFACNRAVKDQLLKLESVHTSLVGQLVWLGFRRKTIPYVRMQRKHGKSGWSFRKKVDYLFDSVFAFTDRPIKALLATGSVGLVMSFVIGVVVLVAKLTGSVPVPGYTPTVLLILFFAALNLFGLGIVGSYAYRAFENSKGRPSAVVMAHERFPGAGDA